jgi:hypothetical protein
VIPKTRPPIAALSGAAFVVMVVAILLVFITLAFQFRSVVLPMLIFLTQPLSLVSGLFALWITGTPLNVSSYMGAILLIGLDMKNGILLVEYIQQLRAEGMELRPALQLAGHTRFRPILMTSFTFILGVVPLVLSKGAGMEMRRTLGVTVFSGMVGLPGSYTFQSEFFERVLRVSLLMSRDSRRRNGIYRLPRRINVPSVSSCTTWLRSILWRSMRPAQSPATCGRAECGGSTRSSPGPSYGSVVSTGTMTRDPGGDGFRRDLCLKPETPE